MKPVKAMGMTADDYMIFKAFFTFMLSPLILLVAIAAGMAVVL